MSTTKRSAVKAAIRKYQSNKENEIAKQVKTKPKNIWSYERQKNCTRKCNTRSN